MMCLRVEVGSALFGDTQVTTIRAFYEDKVNPLWPASVPAMTDEEAVRAAKRLYRFAFKRACKLPVKIVGGRNYSYIRNGVLRVNPSHGWKEVVHVLSHSFFRRLRPNDKPHSVAHARLERDMAALVINGGWLDGKLRPAAKPKADPKQLRYKRTLEGIARWESKAKRAKTALVKLNARRKYYEKQGLSA